jgi:hypothetical protein
MLVGISPMKWFFDWSSHLGTGGFADDIVTGKFKLDDALEIVYFCWNFLCGDVFVMEEELLLRHGATGAYDLWQIARQDGDG